MIDVKAGIRTAFFTALSGHLSYNSVAVPVSDDMKPINNTAPNYVILATQGGTQKNTFSGWASWETINIDVISKVSITTGKLVLDNIVGQILEIICPSVTRTGIAQQPGLSINNVRLEEDHYLPLSLNASNTVQRRILTFKMYVSQL